MIRSVRPPPRPWQASPLVGHSPCVRSCVRACKKMYVFGCLRLLRVKNVGILKQRDHLDKPYSMIRRSLSGCLCEDNDRLLLVARRLPQ